MSKYELYVNLAIEMCDKIKKGYKKWLKNWKEEKFKSLLGLFCNMETEIQGVKRDLEQLKKDVTFIRTFLLEGKMSKLAVSNEGLKKEFQELDSLSDEAFENFEESLWKKEQFIL